MRIQNRRLAPAFCALILALAVTGFAQTSVPAGQRMTVEGVIVSQQAEALTLRSTGGALFNVTLAGGVNIRERKANPFRGARQYSKNDLIPGLQVEVKGTGDRSGALVAQEIRFRSDDLKVAETMDTRVAPVENRLRETQTRLGETEQNAARLSGQVQELTAVSNAARSGAKAAQEAADSALNTAKGATTMAQSAQQGVQAANERITSLDDYSVRNTVTVHFKVGSAVLSPEDKQQLESLAAQIKGERGYIIEVAGFASSDGSAALNRRLSQKRAEAVIQFLAENNSIPLRRFITPIGYGEKQPVADNRTRAGRQENRRVEVRMLVSKGLAAAEGSQAPGPNNQASQQQ